MFGKLDYFILGQNLNIQMIHNLQQVKNYVKITYLIIEQALLKVKDAPVMKIHGMIYIDETGKKKMKKPKNKKLKGEKTGKNCIEI